MQLSKSIIFKERDLKKKKKFPRKFGGIKAKVYLNNRKYFKVMAQG